MKKLFIFLFFIFSINLASTPNCDPLLVVVLMVKNEEKVICQTLEPFVKAGIDSYLVFDTGSEDNTIEVVKNYLEENTCKNAVILQEPFINFATSRNRALNLAKEKFPTSTFFLMIDAEWYAKNVPALLEFLKNNINSDIQSYLVKCLYYPNHSFMTNRVIKANSNAKFVGSVHEVLFPPSPYRVTDDFYIVYNPTTNGYKKSKERWERDEALLLKDIEKNPRNSRALFYLAQTYECLGDLHKAYQYYLKRSQVKGFAEEDYEAFYRLAKLTDKLSKEDKTFTWEMAFNYYSQAIKILPHRAEPFVQIAQHYWPENTALCYTFARRAMDLPYPNNDILFIDRAVYNFHRYEILSKSAWYVGEFTTGELATRKALEVLPNDPQLHINLAAYLKKTKGTK